MLVVHANPFCLWHICHPFSRHHGRIHGSPLQSVEGERAAAVLPMPQIQQIHICDDSDSNESFNAEDPNASLIKQEADFIDNRDDVTEKVMNKTN